MTNPAAERKAAEIADEFLNAEFDDCPDVREWLIEKITAAVEEAERDGYSKAMRARGADLSPLGVFSE